MDPIIYFGLLAALILVLVYLSGWFSGTETALTHLSLVQLAGIKKRKIRNHEYVIKLRKNMNRTLVGILIGNNIVNISLSAIVAIVADSIFSSIGVSIAIGITTFLIIIFGEITPKSHAIRDSEKISSRHSKILYYYCVCIAPLISMFIFITRKLLKMQGIRPRKKEILVSEESIVNLASLGHTEGVLKMIEKDIIHKVFEFGEKKTKDIMVQINSVLTIDQNTSFREAKKIIAKSGFTRIPVIGEKGRIIGVLYSKDLLNRPTGSIKKLMRPPIFFHLSTHITSAFSTMQKKHIHIAVIEDTRDRHVGIITLEDIIEELVGEIEDEYYKVKTKLGFPKI